MLPLLVFVFAALTAFATGSLFLVLPLVADRAKTVLAERGADEEAQRQADVVVPMAFTLAGAGKLLGLVFVLGRALYARAYVSDPARRGPGFLLTLGANSILLLGGLVGAFVAWL